jgi:hypothetical protein
MPQAQRVPMDRHLRLVIVLMFANVGLSVVLTLLMLIFNKSLVDYELAHMHLPAGTDTTLIRQGLQNSLWGRLAGVVIVAVFYVWRAAALRRGSRRAYLRMLWICVIGLAGIVYLIAAANYPWWMRVEQVVQGLVLISLLIAITRPQVRGRYAK